MDRIAIAKRLEGLSRVFSSNSPYHRDLKAMAEVLSKVDDQKFQTILSEDFTSDVGEKEAITGITTPHDPYQHGMGKGPQMGGGYTSIYDGLGDDVKVKLSPKTKTLLMAQPAAGGAKVPVQASDDKEAQLGITPQHTPYQQGQHAGPGLGGGYNSIYDALSDEVKAHIPPQDVQILKMQPFSPPAKKIAPMPGLVREEETAMSAEASDKRLGSFWTKDASEAILNNLLRDVVGMDKKQVEDTHRHLDKGQIPDGTHNGEKASNLKKEQTPDQKDVLKSDIVEKSHGAVRKEAAYEEEKKDDKKEDKKEEKSAASEEEKKDDKKEDKKEEKSASLDDIQKARKEKEQKAMKKDVEKLKEEKKDTDDKKEATINMVDGIELGEPMEDVTLDAAEADKLSKLFE